ncbi:MAG: hypothetical protein WC683_02670 [bacterium]
MPWVKRASRETLSRHSLGTDYGTERDVVLRRGKVCVCKTRGHVGWSGVGCQSYYGPCWMLGSKDSREQDHLSRYGDAGEGRIGHEKWKSWLPKIAEAFGLPVEQLPQKLPRGGTLIWED